jgi:AcrR family transcriptional regulator
MSAPAGARPSYVEASRNLRRDMVLDAVHGLLADRAWTDVSMADVAARSGVSRQTLYNAFGGRQELAQAYVLREADRFVAAVEEAVRARSADPRAALAAALEVFLSAAATHPLVRAISASEDGDELLPLVTTRGGPVLGGVTEQLAALMAATWPGLPQADAGHLADALVRLAISHAALPSASPRATAAAIARIVGPHIDELLER